MDTEGPVAELDLVSGGGMVDGAFYPVGLEFNLQGEDVHTPGSGNRRIRVKSHGGTTGHVSGVFEIEFQGKGHQDNGMKTCEFVPGAFEGDIVGNNAEREVIQSLAPQAIGIDCSGTWVQTTPHSRVAGKFYIWVDKPRYDLRAAVS